MGRRVDRDAHRPGGVQELDLQEVLGTQVLADEVAGYLHVIVARAGDAGHGDRRRAGDDRRAGCFTGRAGRGQVHPYLGRRCGLQVQVHVDRSHVEARIADAGVVGRVDARGVGFQAGPPGLVVTLHAGGIVVAQDTVARITRQGHGLGLAQLGHLAGHGRRQGGRPGPLGHRRGGHDVGGVLQLRAGRAAVPQGQRLAVLGVGGHGLGDVGAAQRQFGNGSSLVSVRL